jgi:phosphopentomutase
MAREEFEKDMRKWAILDNKIRAANHELKDMRSQKTEIGSTICEFMKTKGLENKKVDTGDSIISFYEKNEKCLGEIISDKDKVLYIIKHLKDKREIKKSNDLRRRFKNTSGYETDEN